MTDPVTGPRRGPARPAVGRGGPPATADFWRLAAVNLFVGSMVGLERTVLPILADETFGLAAGVAVAGFIVAFSIAKAVVNLLAGAAADRLGRKRVLVLGWIVSLPVPALLAWAPDWNVVVFANVLLGAGQALTWSMTVNMMVDLMPPHRRGFAAGINEFAGYAGVAATAFLTGLIASQMGLRPWPFVVGMALAALGLALALTVRETGPAGTPPPLRWVRGVELPSLLGLAANLKDGMVWLSLPLLLAGRGMDLLQIGVVTALYPLVWAAGQPVFGPWSDRVGRRVPIALGTLLQGLGLMLFAARPGYPAALAAAALLGLGTAMVYPVLIAAVADRVPLAERATALGIYRFFRDGGYALGAFAAGVGLAAAEPVVAGTGAVFVALALVAWTLLPVPARSIGISPR